MWLLKNKFIIIILITVFALFIPQNTFAQGSCTPGAISDISPGCPCNTDNQCITGGVSFVCKGNPKICQSVSASGTYGNQTATGWKPTTAYGVWAAGDGNGDDGALPILVHAATTLFPSNGGAFDQAFGYTAALYQNKPASTSLAISDFKENIGIKSAYAQQGGVGFQALSPVLSLWRVARNIALAGFVVVFVVIGIMVILRSKIDPRTVITIQQAIPQIFVALILVIFSYAICGLLVDGVTILTRIGATALQTAGFIAQDGTGSPVSNTQQAGTYLTNLTSANIFALFDDLQDVDVLIASLANLDDQLGLIANVLKFDASGGGGLTRLILFIAIFSAMIRTFFMLLTSYLYLTLNIIFSPFKFFLFAIPGSQGGLEGWFRQMLSHLLVFPTAFFMLALGAVFFSQSGSSVWYANNSDDPNLWRTGQEPFGVAAQYWAAPGLGNWGSAVGPLLTLGILLTVPKAAEMVKEAVNPKAHKSASDGAAGQGLQSAAMKVPLVGSFARG